MVDRQAHKAPLIAHIVYRFDVGGLENGLVNLINHTPKGRYRHAIVCLTYATRFQQRLTDPVPIFALHKREGKDLAHYLKLWRLLRDLRPDIVHTRNLATVEAHYPAWLAGVPGRVHGEHGWDVQDVDGHRRKYQWLRRAHAPLIDRYIALSGNLETYLREQIGVAATRLSRIRNGVDTGRFAPGSGRRAPDLEGFAPRGTVVIGTVGRMEAVKDQTTLVRAFIALTQTLPEPERLRLLIVGEGSLREPAQRMLEEAGLSGQAWLTGARDDVVALYRSMDIFVLPSLAEGICNTILEAMACGLPVVATDVGGNSELVAPGKTGALVPRSDPHAMAAALRPYVTESDLRHRTGGAARREAEARFSLKDMVSQYLGVYDRVMDKKRHGTNKPRAA